MTLFPDYLRSSVEIREFNRLNVERNRAVPALRHGCVLGSNGGSSGCKISTMAIVRPHRVQVCTQMRQSHTFSYKNNFGLNYIMTEI